MSCLASPQPKGVSRDGSAHYQRRRARRRRSELSERLFKSTPRITEMATASFRIKRTPGSGRTNHVETRKLCGRPMKNLHDGDKKKQKNPKKNPAQVVRVAKNSSFHALGGMLTSRLKTRPPVIETWQPGKVAPAPIPEINKFKS